MSIAKHNRTHGGIFSVDTTGFEYKTLAELYDPKQPESEFSVYGVYIGKFYSKRDRREKECCFAASDGYFISLPAHLVDVIKEILTDDESIDQIKHLKAALKIRPYEKDGEQYYTAEFVDVI